MMLRIVLILVAVVVLLPLVLLAAASILSRPPSGLGARDGRLADCPASPNCVGSQATDAGHRVDAMAFQGPPDVAWNTLLAVLADVPRLKTVEQTDGYLRAEATSRLFRFVDDVEFLLDRAAGVIQVRSASRAGKSDFGVNRARIEQIRSRFQAAQRQ